MKLETLTRGQCQLVREWRNNELQFLRTPYMITEKMQDDFYDNVINGRDSKHRYFAIMEELTDEEPNKKGEVYGPYSKQVFIGMGGLTNIEWENGTAEISLIIAPEYRGKGYGKKAVEMLLQQGFGNMRLFSIYGEAYGCGNYEFWKNFVEKRDKKKRNGYMQELCNRKFYNGKMYGSLWFSFNEAVRLTKEDAIEEIKKLQQELEEDRRLIK